ncbi:MAG: ScnB-like protein [Pseudomonadota bacterium]
MTAEPAEDPSRPPKAWFDMGGDTAGAIDPDEHDYAYWEKRVDALVILCQKKGFFTVDGLRRALEDMGPEAFERLSYYERWVGALRRNLVETGVLTPEELAVRMNEIAQRGTTYGDATEGPTRD